MKILCSQPIKSCFDGNFMKEITFTSTIEKDFIDYLAKVGDLEYFADFARPFYRITRQKGYMIKGILGNNYLRIYFLRSYLNESIEHFDSHIHNYNLN